MTASATIIRDHLRTYRFVHIALVMGSILYGLGVFFIHKYSPIPPTLHNAQVLNVIQYASIPYILIIMIIVKSLRAKMLAADSIFTNKENLDEESDKPPFLANYLSQLFILWALLEIITISGIVLFLISGELIFPLAIISMGVFLKILNGPSFEELKQLSKKYDLIKQGA